LTRCKILFYHSQDLRIDFVLMVLNSNGGLKMKTDFQLVGKTITGVVATPGKDNSPHRIWMLQFSDGSHVEFVSPSARRRLNRVTGGHKRSLEVSAKPDQMKINAA
jgi:hypothetical protein